MQTSSRRSAWASWLSLLAVSLVPACGGGGIPEAGFGPGMDWGAPTPADAWDAVGGDTISDIPGFGDDTAAPLEDGSFDTLVPPMDAGPVDAAVSDVLSPPDGAADLPPDLPWDIDGDGTPDGQDCAPLDPLVHPGAEELCNGVDDDCNGDTDEDLGVVFCGMGECLIILPACQGGEWKDCVPHPSVDEVCDGLDNDCDGATDEELPDITCGLGPCQNTVSGCVDHKVPPCTPLELGVPEICDGLDNDCDGVVDEDLPALTCGSGPCQNTVEACVGGVTQACIPFAPPPGTCNAPPAPCKTTTTGVDACGLPCSKTGPAFCYTVHPACYTSGPGNPTDTPQCVTPKGKFICGLTCQEWPNTIGADCTYCVNIHCKPKNGLDEAQFLCNNIPIPATP